jgi:hypothetical protein
MVGLIGQCVVAFRLSRTASTWLALTFGAELPHAFRELAVEKDGYTDFLGARTEIVLWNATGNCSVDKCPLLVRKKSQRLGVCRQRRFRCRCLSRLPGYPASDAPSFNRLTRQRC